MAPPPPPPAYTGLLIYENNARQCDRYSSIDWDRSELLKLVTNSVGPTQLLSLGTANLLELGPPDENQIL